MEITYIAKRIILPAALMLCLSSCKKEIIDYNQRATTTGSGNPIKLSEDELLRNISYKVTVQNVKTSVKENVLTMVYTEDISAVLDAKGYDLSYNIQLNEDFSASALSKFNFTVPAPNGTVTTDWAGNNLKLLNEVTKTDVNVDGKAMVNLRLLRYFTFSKQYATHQQAIDQQNILLTTKTNVVKFTSFVVFLKEYPATTTLALLVYTK